MRQDTEDLLQIAGDWKRAGHKVAIATVTATWGSGPRPAGSHMIVNETGHMLGSVSGGCIESAVVQEAVAVMEDGKPRRLDFGISDARAWEVGLTCGGKLQIYLERVE